MYLVMSRASVVSRLRGILKETDAHHDGFVGKYNDNNGERENASTEKKMAKRIDAKRNNAEKIQTLAAGLGVEPRSFALHRKHNGPLYYTRRNMG